MPYHIQPFRYAIDNWRQAVNARSNNDPTLRIKVTDFVSSMILQGLRIQVVHPQYGIVFACLTEANGRLVNSTDSVGLTTTQIIAALTQLGFDITFKETIQVEGPTREFLVAARDAGYTHVRYAPVRVRSLAPTTRNQLVTVDRVVCFNENKNPELLKQYIKPIVPTQNLKMAIMIVSPNNNPNLNFNWLTMPMEIQSVLTDNL